MKGKDVFAILPTGYRKTACFACVPVAFDYYLERSCGTESSIVIVISPLTALIKDQVSGLTKHGLSCGYIDAKSSADVKIAVNNGQYNIVFMSPELLVGKWRKYIGK